MNTEQARFNMIEQQIRPWDVLDLGAWALLRFFGVAPAATAAPAGQAAVVVPK